LARDLPRASQLLITGSMVALGFACLKLLELKAIERMPIVDYVAAISAGIVGGEVLLDLDYAEDSNAEVDVNIAITGSGQLVELHAAAEGRPYSAEELNKLIEVARPAIDKLLAVQRATLKIDLARP